MFAERPVWGYGSGSFVAEYRKRHPHSSQTLSASHTIAITIAAEQGLIGEIAYIALVLVAVVRAGPGRARRPGAGGDRAPTFIALVFHTMLYADFLEDPRDLGAAGDRRCAGGHARAASREAGAVASDDVAAVAA